LLDLARVDLYGTSNPVIVYRWAGSSLEGYLNLLFYTDDLPVEIATKQEIPFEILRTLHPLELGSLKATPPWRADKEAPVANDYNLLNVAGKIVVLEAPSLSSDRAFFHGGVVDVYAYIYQTPSLSDEVCYLRPIIQDEESSR
jgi:hypothetical protein